MEQKPTHSVVARFVSSLVPPVADDVSLLFHVPQKHNYNFDTAVAEQIILSVTPSPNVYQAIGTQDNGPKAGCNGHRQGSEEARPPHTIAFLHHPFALDPTRIRDDLLVLASHKSFDEHLTVGWNPALAAHLDIDTFTAMCVFGYDEPHRKIGAIFPVNKILGPLIRSIEFEFGAIEHAQEGLSEEIYVVAIMNAFSAKEVHRVLDLAENQGWVESAEECGRHVLYLTGDLRKSGLEAAKRRGMTVVCVGKTSAEQWGISYMASRLRDAFPALTVKEMYEDELTDRNTLADSTTESSE